MTLERALERIAELEEQVRQLETVLGYGLSFPPGIKLTKREARILGVLMNGLGTHEMLMEAIYPNDPTGGPVTWYRGIQVAMVRLRRKMAPHNIEIKTRSGIGYEVVDRSLINLRELAKLKANVYSIQRNRSCRLRGVAVQLSR